MDFALKFEAWCQIFSSASMIPKSEVDRGHWHPPFAVPIISGLGQATLDACHFDREIACTAKHRDPCLALKFGSWAYFSRAAARSRSALAACSFFP
jgi:hypothetical protein